MLRTLTTAGIACAALAAAPALAQHAHGGGGGGGIDVGAGAGMNAGGPAQAGLDARMNSMGPANASATGVMHANSNSVLGTDTTGSRVTGRVNSQGALHASPTGIAHASANSVLKGSTVVSGLLTGLAAGMPVSFNGNTVGTVNRIVTSNDGTVRRVLVTGTDGRTYSLSPTTLSLSGGILTTTTFRG